MNVQSIWAGEYYAYKEYKGHRFPMDAKKGKAIRVEKEQRAGRERATAYVIFEIELTKYDYAKNEYIPTGETREVRIRARDVVDFWDDYEAERNGIREEQEEKRRKQEEEYQRRREEREERMRKEREEAERKVKEQEERRLKLIDAFVEKTGVPRHAILTVSQTSVTLDRVNLEFWLSGVANGLHAN